MVFTCSRLLQIFSSKANYKALKQELDLAAEYPIIVNRDDNFDVLSCKPRSALRSLVREPHYGLDWFEDAENLAKDLDDDSQLIDTATLVNLYPKAGWPADVWRAVVAATKKVTVPIHVSPLTEMTVKKFVKVVQEDGGCDEGLLQVFLWNGNLERTLRNYLSRYEKDMATPGPAGQLLKVAFAEMEHVNLTPWTALPIDAIKTILHSECVSPYVRTVSISSRICPSDAEALAEALPPDGIEELYMLRNLNPGEWTMLLIRDTPDSQGLDPVPRYKIGFIQTKNPIEAKPESADTLVPEDLTVVSRERFLCATAPEIDMGSLRSLEESLTELAKKFVDKGRLAWICQEPLISTTTEEEAYSLLKTALNIRSS
ncbi:hypothetical protein DL764_001151 [Monosporascus ibericus]|uniref:Uncharacterized protein n=1 Tax=Monosporascus ibericus TaxID=155417 RepID=A0A4Q4TQU3_9PEZI|nr:hypothetical protein DL764_001151 [Monosporascus ibericus]